MSDFRIPELPSDEELGITDADRKAFEEDAPQDSPELSAEEMAALLGEAPRAAGEKPKKAKKPKAESRWFKKRAAPKPPATERVASAAGAGTSGPEAGAAPRPARPVEGPRLRWRGLMTLAVLVALSVMASSRTGLPRPVPANAPDTVFSSARAMSSFHKSKCPCFCSFVFPFGHFSVLSGRAELLGKMVDETDL
jgi:hypothetical protein